MGRGARLRRKLRRMYEPDYVFRRTLKMNVKRVLQYCTQNPIIVSPACNVYAARCYDCRGVGTQLVGSFTRDDVP